MPKYFNYIELHTGTVELAVPVFCFYNDMLPGVQKGFDLFILK